MSNPARGEGDPVVAVGWAESDYWAMRAWSRPPFEGPLVASEPEWDGPPSLSFLGRPPVLSYGEVKNFEREVRGGGSAAARYRLTDGAFLYVAIRSQDGISYMFGSNEPKPGDLPVAIEFRLRDSG